MSNPFLERFSEGWDIACDDGTQDEITTASGVLRLLERCLQGEVPFDQVAVVLDPVGAAVRAVKDASQVDLDRSPDLDPAVRLAAEETIEGYEAILDAFDLAASGDEEGVVEAVELLGEACAWVSERVRLLSDWNEPGQLVCPRCGSQEPDPDLSCESCGVSMLQPDPHPPDFPAVHLGERYVQLFQACVAVGTGQGALAALEVYLGPVEQELRQAQGLVGRAGGEAFEPVLEHLDASLEGVAQLRRFLETRALVDLNQGWLKLSLAASELQVVLPELELE